MALILNIETATKNCSVALALDGKTIGFRETATENYSHAEQLHVFIQSVIKDAGIVFTDLSAITVSQGPGSYTGLRIGVSAAKGLCFALNIPLIALDTLTILAQQVTIDDGLIIPMIDARRMEVYSAVFNAQMEMIREVQAQIISSESFSEVTAPIYIVGDCQEKLQPVLSHSNVIFLNEVVFPSATNMVQLGYEKFKRSDFEDLAYFEPYYLKDFMITKKQQLNV